MSNSAMCCLKKCEIDSSNRNPELRRLFIIIMDITSTIKHMDKHKFSMDTKTIRSKLLYRRAKARYTLAIRQVPPATTSPKSISISHTELMELLSSAQTDLFEILSFDTNKAAHELILEIKRNSPNILELSGISSSSSAMGGALNNLKLALNEDNGEANANAKNKILQSLKFIHATILDDLTDGANELLKNDNWGGTMLFHLGFPLGGIMAEEASEVELQVQVLALKCLASACAYPAFYTSMQSEITYYNNNIVGGDSESELSTRRFESLILGLMTSKSSSKELLNAIMMLQMRFTVNSHVQEDDANYLEESLATGEKGEDFFTCGHQVAVVTTALKSCYEECRSTGLNVLSAWLEPNPLRIIDSSGASEETSRVPFSKVKEPSDDEVNQMPARKLANYRKRCAQRSRGRVERSRKNALEFCRNGGLDVLVSSAASSIKGYWRRECVLAIGRVMNCVRDEAVSKGEDGTFIDEHTKKTIREFFKEEVHQLVIEEVDEDSVDQVDDISELISCVKRCLFATALLVANGELGEWGLKQWKNATSDWHSLAVCGENRFMATASECASAAAGIEGARSWISGSIDIQNVKGAWKHLLTSDDNEVRSSMASAMAKLGLANKHTSSDEGELFALLEVAVGLLGEDQLSTNSNLASDNFNSVPLERGIELLSYLATKTSIKDEIVHGLAFSSVLEKLVELSDPKTVLSPAISYSVANIFTSLSVSIETLRREAFEGKEITPEQYDEMQALGKTAEEKELEVAKKEFEDPTAVSSRVNKMVQLNVPRALVNLVGGGSQSTREQAVTAMMRISCAPSARGAMIQQGCLSACIKLVKGVSICYWKL